MRVLARLAVSAIAVASTPGTLDGAEVCAPPVSWKLADFELSLTRDECYGECPSYEIVLRGDGSVSYKGLSFVAIRGEASYQVSKDTVVQVVRSLYDARFFDFAYGEVMQFEVVGDDDLVVAIPRPYIPPTDVPQVSLEVRIGEFVRSRRFDRFGSEDFWRLASRIDDLLATERLVNDQD